MEKMTECQGLLWCWPPVGPGKRARGGAGPARTRPANVQAAEAGIAA